MANKQAYEIHINGTVRRVKAYPAEPLLWVIRDLLDLTGTKFGCGEGACGACDVLLDGEPTHSCMMSVADVGDSEITTIEGLAQDGELTALQKAFVEHNGYACGYCTPGMIINATALLKRKPMPTREEIIEAMDDNLCRCAVYENIIRAIESAARGGMNEQA